eukprot:826587-Rhodomonas_salina.2
MPAEAMNCGDRIRICPRASRQRRAHADRARGHMLSKLERDVRHAHAQQVGKGCVMGVRTVGNEGERGGEGV